MYTAYLQRLSEAGLLRTIADRNCPQGRTILRGGAQLLNFASNDYLGLAAGNVITGEARRAMADFGLGAGASRLLSGGCTLHGELERKVAAFKGTEAALVFNSGYTANVSAIPALATKEGAIFSDELNHASIVDGCRLSGAERFVYRHGSLSHLAELLQASTRTPKLVITESVFSMDGDVADIGGICELCKAHNALLYVDDAHATGVLAGGRGSLAYFNIPLDDNIIQMGTFSKALGSMGGFIAASGTIIEYLVNSARGLIYSTALPAPVVAASLAAIDYVQGNPDVVATLHANIANCKRLLQLLGIHVHDAPTAIVPIYVETVADALRISGQLTARGIYAPAIRPPTVKQPRIRISLSALHSDEDIKHLSASLAEVIGCP
ncbi:MAG: 8-amino-7-oxononanoate synthase [Nitrospirae bacterium]|uniref:aminotransferase class I/II-fold pyridoxal phosphate-dependent enzyme n=1 Tax=Candidatus Magnetobacterium casense TaxID=1455061 RepID=UPI00058CF74C|nr:8-amino-7-oxononanoate synthase [Candidatus Magnetobacterium casensis]MBF0339075.1 8-amino-7-oxononanoate synthase [Nitrospirota bacterium]